MKKIIVILVPCLFFLSGMAIANDYIKATDIQKVNLGDTFEEVSKKIGEPNQILSKEYTSDYKEKVIWLYEAIEKPKRKAPNPFTSDGETKLEYEQRYSILRNQNPPYLIIFLNGKVSRVERQVVDVAVGEPVKVKVE